MKRVIAFLVCFTLLFSLCACGSKKENEEDKRIKVTFNVDPDMSRSEKVYVKTSLPVGMKLEVEIRGGAYKPRTSPYAFQGLGYQGLLNMAEARERTGLPIVSEVMSADKVDEFVENVDLVQIGARNMQNFDLLKAVGHINKPVLLKRGMSATIEDWIMSAEYIMAAGNPNVIFCERGIRTFEKYTRNTMDLAVIPIIKEKTHLPIIIDPSHATGDWKLIEPMALAAIAAGADGRQGVRRRTARRAFHPPPRTRRSRT